MLLLQNLHLSKNMNFFSQALSPYYFSLRSCFHCHSFLSRSSNLCLPCENEILSLKKTLSPEGIPIYSLVRWTNEPEAWISKMAHSYKHLTESEWHKIFQSQLVPLSGLPWRPDTLLIDPASRPDHSYRMAKALSRITGAPHQPFLFQKKISSQAKNLSSSQRKIQIQYEINPNTTYSAKSSQPHLLFIDDIVTTGNTWRNIYVLLEKPKHFSVLTFFHRI